jgi:hypothetical protein
MARHSVVIEIYCSILSTWSVTNYLIVHDTYA